MLANMYANSALQDNNMCCGLPHCARTIVFDDIISSGKDETHFISVHIYSMYSIPMPHIAQWVCWLYPTLSN